MSKSNDGDDNLLGMIQQAMAAYDLAAAPRAQAKRDAEFGYERRLADIAARENAITEQEERRLRGQPSAVPAETTRLELLASLAEDLMKSAANLLEHAALSHVRGFSPGSAGIVHSHTATDEQTAAAFTAAQLASAELRTA